MTQGRLIVLEGSEGTGKSTQAQRLAAWLAEHGEEVVLAREPGGTEVGEHIREILLQKQDLSVPASTELLLILAARSAFVRELVRPALDRGAWVISDRFDLSSLAYQGYGRGIPLDVIKSLNAYATDGVVPDLYLVLDVDPAVGHKRQVAQGKSGDRIESEGLEFLSRVRDGYRALASSTERAAIVDAAGDVDLVEALIHMELRDRFPETFAGLEV